MEAAALVRMLGGDADADHHLEACDGRGDQLTPADAALLRHRKRGRERGRAGMRAGIGLRQVVELERVRQRAIRERRRWCVYRHLPGAEDIAAATRTVALGIIDDDPAPRQIVAEQDRRDRVGDGVLGALDDRRRKVLVLESGRIFGELDCFIRHRHALPA